MCNVVFAHHNFPIPVSLVREPLYMTVNDYFLFNDRTGVWVTASADKYSLLNALELLLKHKLECSCISVRFPLSCLPRTCLCLRGLIIFAAANADNQNHFLCNCRQKLTGKLFHRTWIINFEVCSCRPVPAYMMLGEKSIFNSNLPIFFISFKDHFEELQSRRCLSTGTVEALEW